LAKQDKGGKGNCFDNNDCFWWMNSTKNADNDGGKTNRRSFVGLKGLERCTEA
jgi:hypothetical protein